MSLKKYDKIQNKFKENEGNMWFLKNFKYSVVISQNVNVSLIPINALTTYLLQGVLTDLA